MRRGPVEEVTAALGSVRVVAEQYFLDNHTYVDAPCPDSTRTFSIACEFDATTYTITGTGSGNMDGFAYTIDEADLRTTAGPWGTGNCWITRTRTAADARIRRLTLVELLITLTVISILLVLSVPTMRVSSNRPIRTAGSPGRTGLALARTEAVRLNAPVEFVADAAGWQVRTVVNAEVLHRGSARKATPGLR